MPPASIRITYQPGETAQSDLWFPEPTIPVGHGQLMLPVLVITLGFSRFLTATMVPSRQAGDILAGMWQLINGLGMVPKALVSDRESAIGGTGIVTVRAASFAGWLSTRIQLAPPRDSEFKGMVERNNGYFETSFLPGRSFASPADFNTQLDGCGEEVPRIIEEAGANFARVIRRAPGTSYPKALQDSRRSLGDSSVKSTLPHIQKAA